MAFLIRKLILCNSNKINLLRHIPNRSYITDKYPVIQTAIDKDSADFKVKLLNSFLHSDCLFLFSEKT